MEEKFVFLKTLTQARFAIEEGYSGCYIDDAYLGKEISDINELEDYPRFKCLYFDQSNYRLHNVYVYNDFEASEKCATDAMRKFLTLKYGNAYISALRDYVSAPLEKLIREQK